MIRHVVLKLLYEIRKNRKRGGYLLFALISLSVFGNAVTFYYFDGVYREISVSDSLWYSVVSLTTIGYGDYSATSTGARIGTFVFVILLGLATFTIFLSIVTEGVTSFIVRGQRGLERFVMKNHILVVNFPSRSRVYQIIKELQADEKFKETDIVLVTDQIEQVPFSMKNVYFVCGSPFEEDTFTRANINDAQMALILAPNYASINSDALVASSVAVIESLNPSVYTVAECMDQSHKLLFKATQCDAIVTGIQTATNIMVQEVHDPGVSSLIEMITSNVYGPTLYSVKVEEERNQTYLQLSQGLLVRGINFLMVINHEGRQDTTLNNRKILSGDRLIYLSKHRYQWNDLIAMSEIQKKENYL